MTRRESLQRSAIAMISAARANALGRGDRVRLIRLPDGGIQPQVVLDHKGTVHLVYYTGDARRGDLFYVRSDERGDAFTSPLRVNRTGSAIAAGTIRGAQIALGRNGRVHVAWNGSSAAELKGPVNPESGKPGAPMLYSRLNDDRTGFEPERNLMAKSYALDGGGSVACDTAGNVYVLWHGNAVQEQSELTGEASRRVWVAKSSDEGRAFGPEVAAWDRRTGACACCGMKAFAGPNGRVYALYRSAVESVHRDIYLLRSADKGETFKGHLLHEWDINACPMSSMDFAENAGWTVGAWETGGQVYWSPVDGPSAGSIKPVAAPGLGKGRKHPRVALNKQGELLMIWTEGTGWQKGGSLAWQLFDAAGNPRGETGSAAGVPVWSFAAPVTHADGSVSIFY